MYLSYNTQCEPKGTIRIKKENLKYRLGALTCADGERWHIYGYIGRYVQACPLSGVHDYYTSTAGSSYGMVGQSWQPYHLEII